MRTTTAWQSSNGSLDPDRVTIERRDLRPDDVAVRIDFCGICHSDLHQIHGHAAGGSVIPGHEFVGAVTEVGAAVTRFAPGDPVAVGTIVDSCGECDMCRAGEEVYCATATRTYAHTDRVDGLPTNGGWSREYVLTEGFVFPLPADLDPAGAAPLLCAGVTVWNPLRRSGIGPGSRVAVAGLGGLGHLAVKFAAALGAEVSVISRTADKHADALALGATDLVVSGDPTHLAASAGRFDLVLDTIPAPHDLGPLLGLLRTGGNCCVVGWFAEMPVDLMGLMLGRKSLSSSATGGRPSTAEMLAFCAEHGITADVEVLPSAQVGNGLARLEKGDVRYRFVLDLADLD
ncbi:alcohol dehydrogenase catalytic domain-containing protein [Nakamurella sp. YIM 132087]|uniref:alcohol dehydrogenase (NADP(+)) n=1 Tax=Nakamurella alba TaxID=2665158 RepID=A0A7K1FS63_9ACTN|nr:NAD(P)-dependent alcohol dehydrogenase [Nakamurella alba]MTD16910.1 alcohol dehydrogenase catalytic domain-containing protein [Nakamurella alba]